MATRIIDNNHLRRLQILANPTETARIECKSWLDLNDNLHKAKLAKEAIALANYGGGTIVLGITEDNASGKKLVCQPRPSHVARYTSDAIASAINKYAEPELHFDLVFENHPNTGDEYAFVEISGGLGQPVFAKKQLDGVIKKLACYIRKPGPKSEVPHTAQEWQDLMARCVKANRDSMLDSIRIIMDGRPMDTAPAPSEEDRLREFMRASKARWQERLEEVDEDDVARLRHGYWEFAFSIVGASTWPTRNDLWRILEEARPAGSHRRLFAIETRQGMSPYPAEGAIEAWTGNPEGNSNRDPFRCSFWRATLGGEFYHLGGFFEDSGYSRRHIEPGTRHHHDISIRLHAMMLRFAARIANSVDEEAEIVICSEMTGLKGRYLTGSQATWSPDSGDPRISIDSVVLPPQRFTSQQINDNLPEILCDLLHPCMRISAFTS